MRLVKGMFFVLAGIVILIQFIRPARNTSEGESPYDITTKLKVPQEVQTIFRTSCYDCHSNNTRYPWYAEVQPVGWFLSDDIQKGKKQLNFSEFGSYPVRRQYIKLNDIIEQLTEEKMPVPAYTMVHSNAKLSAEQRDLVIEWAKSMQVSMKASYPPDSLARKR